MNNPLTPAEITQALTTLTGWQQINHTLVKTFDCPTYLDALALVQRIGVYADSVDHHPDMHLAYKTLTVTYWTHTANGITQLDTDSAQEVDAIAETFLKQTITPH